MFSVIGRILGNDRFKHEQNLDVSLTPKIFRKHLSRRIFKESSTTRKGYPLETRLRKVVYTSIQQGFSALLKKKTPVEACESLTMLFEISPQQSNIFVYLKFGLVYGRLAHQTARASGRASMPLLNQRTGDPSCHEKHDCGWHR